MTSSQPNTRRRSARLAFDDDENGIPAKKSKTEEAAHRTEKRADARVNGETGKKSKKSKCQWQYVPMHDMYILIDAGRLSGLEIVS